MRYLGLDLGARSLGLALSDKLGVVATFYANLRYEDEDKLIEQLKEIILKENVECLVLGLPKNMNNSYGFRAQETLEFKEKLEAVTNIPVELEDERLTTSLANQVLIKADMSRKKRKAVKDGVSAVIILQSYLDRKGR